MAERKTVEEVLRYGSVACCYRCKPLADEYCAPHEHNTSWDRTCFMCRKTIKGGDPIVLYEKNESMRFLRSAAGELAVEQVIEEDENEPVCESGRTPTRKNWGSDRGLLDVDG